MNMRHPAFSRAPAFTMVEVLFAASILVLAVSAILHAISAGQMQTYEAVLEFRAQLLAEAMVDEVLSYPYLDPGGDTTEGPDAGESGRGTFDAADDFHGFREDPDEVADADGVLYPTAFQGFTRVVSALYGDQTVTTQAGSFLSHGLIVNVTVTDSRGLSWTITHFEPEAVP